MKPTIQPNPKVKSHRRYATILGVAALLTVGIGWGIHQAQQAGQKNVGRGEVRLIVGQTQETSDEKENVTEPTSKTDTPIPSTVNTPEAEAAYQAILHFQNALATLAQDTSLSVDQKKDQARVLLQELRDTLRQLPADQAAAALIAFLNTGSDASTGLGFTLASGGILNEAPTVRTALLDLLGQFDPSLSVSYAQEIFQQSLQPDEWAIAMRNLGWQNQGGQHTAELRTRLTEMLDQTNWLSQPSDGFLQAFDTAVHLSGREEFTSMASLLGLEDTSGRPVENGVNHAAYMALDRITTQAPDQILPLMASEPQLLAWSPMHRGSLIARADVRSPDQLRALETCLGAMAGRPQELETFTRMFPNRNGLLTDALITTPREETPHDQLLAGDQAALAVVNQWLDENRFPGLTSNLQTISARLGQFVASAEDR